MTRECDKGAVAVKKAVLVGQTEAETDSEVTALIELAAVSVLLALVLPLDCPVGDASALSVLMGVAVGEKEDSGEALLVLLTLSTALSAAVVLAVGEASTLLLEKDEPQALPVAKRENELSAKDAVIDTDASTVAVPPHPVTVPPVRSEGEVVMDSEALFVPLAVRAAVAIAVDEGGSDALL